MMASLDHAMWFHRPFRADEWLLYAQDSPSASGSRGLARGLVFTADGVLVASVVQEGLIRRIGVTRRRRAVVGRWRHRGAHSARRLHDGEGRATRDRRRRSDRPRSRRCRVPTRPATDDHDAPPPRRPRRRRASTSRRSPTSTSPRPWRSGPATPRSTSPSRAASSAASRSRPIDDDDDARSSTSSATAVLDISDDVINDGERGLLGLTFSTDGNRLYVAYTGTDDRQHLDEYEMGADRVSGGSRRELLVIDDFAPNHNGGQHRLRPRRLPVLGHGRRRRRRRPGSDSGQNPGDLLGSILRIDPDVAPEDQRRRLPLLHPRRQPVPPTAAGRPRCGPAGCATRGGSASTAPPATSGSPTSARARRGDRLPARHRRYRRGPRRQPRLVGRRGQRPLQRRRRARGRRRARSTPMATTAGSARSPAATSTAARPSPRSSAPTCSPTTAAATSAASPSATASGRRRRPSAGRSTSPSSLRRGHRRRALRPVPRRARCTGSCRRDGRRGPLRRPRRRRPRRSAACGDDGGRDGERRRSPTTR